MKMGNKAKSISEWKKENRESKEKHRKKKIKTENDSEKQRRDL